MKKRIHLVIILAIIAIVFNINSYVYGRTIEELYSQINDMLGSSRKYVYRL